jgi:phage protein D
MWIPRREAALANSETRVPTMAVFASGVPVAGILDVEVSSSNYLAADRYRLRASLTASGYDIWATDQIDLEIRMGLDGAWASMITGPVDRIDVDPSRGEVSVEGRDFTARFIEARIRQNFENQTSSQIALTLAARRGLVPAVVPTTALVGRDFQNDYARTTLDQHARVTTEWDLLVRLAELEGFDVWIEGQSLYFAPASQSSASLALSPRDCMSMRLQRNLPLAAGLSVAVKSWDCRGSQAIVQSAASDGAAGDAPDYVVVRPNLSADAAQSLAQRLLSQMAQQGRCITIDMPGDLTTQPRGVLSVFDTSTDFDGLYVITSVERRMSFHEGFTQTLEARIPPWTVF